jgi:kinase suppressor of Ras 2
MASSRGQIAALSEEILTSEVAASRCQDVQHMIDINSEHLERLRTPMALSSEITKQEIRTLEGKLIKHFSQQLATKATLNAQKHGDVSAIAHYPSLQQWLKVVGITKESADILESRVRSLECLKEKTDSELNRLLLQVNQSLDLTQITKLNKRFP